MLNFGSYIKQENKALTKDQEKSILESEEYVAKHKLNDLFNELLAQIVWKQPDDVKAALKLELENIKKLKKLEGFFDNKDFEVLFDNYDVQSQGWIKFGYVVLILKSIDVDYDNVKYQNTFNKSADENSRISRKHFLEIVEKEYTSKINKSEVK